MAKLVALLAALLIVAHAASAFRTTITTIETDVEGSSNPGRGREQCREQVQQRDLSPCMRVLQQRQRQRSYDDELNDETEAEFRQCCDELRMIHDEECRCEGLQMQMQHQQGRMEPREMSQMMEKAQMLPNMCGMRPSRCRFDMTSY